MVWCDSVAWFPESGVVFALKCGVYFEATMVYKDFFLDSEIHGPEFGFRV